MSYSHLVSVILKNAMAILIDKNVQNIMWKKTIALWYGNYALISYTFLSNIKFKCTAVREKTTMPILEIQGLLW